MPISRTNPPVSVIVGAGAALEVGGPSTSLITQSIRQTYQHIVSVTGAPSTTRQFIDQVATQLDTYFGSEGCHFEDIFHTLEMLDSCVYAGLTSTAKEFKPHFFPFFNPATGNWLNTYAISTAKNDLLRTIADLIRPYDASFDPIGGHSWFANFWRQFANNYSLDIGTLNYDRTIEASIAGIPFEDGYPNLGTTPIRFDPLRLIQFPGTRIMHLHGSTLFGYSNSHSNSFQEMYEDYFSDVFKYPDENAALATWFHRSNSHAQSGESIVGGPIITGLRKTDKLLAYPYTTYSAVFSESILQNRSLLIIGYSFGDLYLNALIGKMASIHGSNRRIVVVSYLNDPIGTWHPDNAVGNWASIRMFGFLSRAFRQNPIATNYSFVNPLISSDSCARLYLEGTRNALETHGPDIIRFLSS